MGKFDWRWPVLGVIALLAVVIAIIVNMGVVDDSSNKFLGGVAVDNSDLKVNWERYQTLDIELSESFTITESGTYHLTGSLTDGQIIVNAGVSEVRLILDNVSINNSTGPAIIGYNAENLVIELIGENTLADGETYDLNYDEDVDGVIYSKADLAFTGSGALNIVANHGDGIVGKDDVVIRDGVYNVITVDDGIRGKDSVYVTNGTLTIDAGGDAIKSTNNVDFGKGFVMIENGDFTIKTVGKGIKAENTILMYGGNLILNTNDDAVHSDNHIGIAGGTLTIDSGDDGVHANNELIIDDGTINITKSYEGMEAQVVTINNGMINITASDDGLNAGGGVDNSAVNRPGSSPFAGDEKCILTIGGGMVYINAFGDGIDSNGYLVFNGGYTVVDGPISNGNGALDSGLGITIQGGTVIAVGSVGMAESLGANSDVCNISVFFNQPQKAGTNVEIRNSNDEVILSHTANKTFSHLSAGSEALLLGETYTIYLDNEEYQKFTILEVTTVVGNDNVGPDDMMPRR